MPKLNHTQIRENVTRNEVVTNIAGEALITKIIKGNGIKFPISSGADTGTGDVTIAVDETQVDHSSLKNRGNDDHTQYVHTANPREITGQHTFKPAIGQAPFLVDTLTPIMVHNLNCEYIGGMKYDTISQNTHAHDSIYYKINEDITIVKANAYLTLDANAGSGGGSIVNHKVAGAIKAYVGVSAIAGGLITGSAIGDYNIRAMANSKMLVSFDNGMTTTMKVYGTGNTGIIESSHRFRAQNTDGLTATQIFKDGSGVNKTMTIKGGIITSIA